MEPALIFTVTETFQIADKGLVLAPGPVPGGPAIQFGDVIELRRPDGGASRARVVGLANAGGGIHTNGVPVMVVGVTASDVPAGTEAWST